MGVNSKRNAQKGVLKIYKNTSYPVGFTQKIWGKAWTGFVILVDTGWRISGNEDDLRLCLAIFPLFRPALSYRGRDLTRERDSHDHVGIVLVLYITILDGS